MDYTWDDLLAGQLDYDQGQSNSFYILTGAVDEIDKDIEIAVQTTCLGLRPPPPPPVSVSQQGLFSHFASDVMWCGGDGDDKFRDGQDLINRDICNLAFENGSDANNHVSNYKTKLWKEQEQTETTKPGESQHSMESSYAYKLRPRRRSTEGSSAIVENSVIPPQAKGGYSGNSQPSPDMCHFNPHPPVAEVKQTSTSPFHEVIKPGRSSAPPSDPVPRRRLKRKCKVYDDRPVVKVASPKASKSKEYRIKKKQELLDYQRRVGDMEAEISSLKRKLAEKESVVEVQRNEIVRLTRRLNEESVLSPCEKMRMHHHMNEIVKATTNLNREKPFTRVNVSRAVANLRLPVSTSTPYPAPTPSGPPLEPFAINQSQNFLISKVDMATGDLFFDLDTVSGRGFHN